VAFVCASYGGCGSRCFSRTIRDFGFHIDYRNKLWLLELDLAIELHFIINLRPYAPLGKPFSTRLARLAVLRPSDICLFCSSPGLIQLSWQSKPKEALITAWLC
jgi:hypothetical protein